MKKSGFTLIELLVVIAIIGILTGIVIAFVVSAKNQGNDAGIKQEMNQLRNRAETLYGNYGGGYADGNSASTCTGQPPLPSYCVQGSRGILCGQTQLLGFNSIFQDLEIKNSLIPAIIAGAGSASNVLCDVTPSTWAVSVQLRSGSSWCVDNTPTAKSGGIGGTGLCV